MSTPIEQQETKSELWKQIAKLYAESHEAGTHISLLWPDQFADKALRLCEAAALAALPEKLDNPPETIMRIARFNTGHNQAIATAQANIHSVFGGKSK